MTEKEIHVMSNLALVFLNCRQSKKAVAFLRALVLLEKENEQYLYALACAHLQLEQADNALRVLRLASNKVDQALPHLLSAQALAKLKRLDEAKQELALYTQKRQITINQKSSKDDHSR